jgi:hypothetical protein
VAGSVRQYPLFHVMVSKKSPRSTDLFRGAQNLEVLWSRLDAVAGLSQAIGISSSVVPAADLQ